MTNTPDTLRGTAFLDRFGQAMKQVQLDAFELAEFPPEAASKTDLHLFKMAEFSGQLSANRCYRTDAFVTCLYGAEIDYDEGKAAYQEAVDKLQGAGVASVVYTSASHTGAAPKWRILLPFSEPYTGSEEQMRAYRKAAIQHVEQILEFPVANESYTLSQAFYYGKVTGAPYLCDSIEGEFIDKKYDLAQALPVVNGKSDDGFMVKAYEGVDVGQAIEAVLSGEHLHEPLRALSARYARQGMSQADILATLRAHMKGSEAEGSGRWKERWRDLPRLVKSAIEKYQEKRATRMRGVQPVEIEAGTNMADAFRSLCKVTQEDTAQIKEEKALYERVIFRGHMIGFAGFSGAGKTILMEYICTQIKKQHPEVEILYLNMDIGAAQIPRAERVAREGGYDLLCPDFKEGASIEKVLAMLYTFAEGDHDLSEYLLVIDTLKKLVDIINKHEARKLYSMLRALTGRGATLVSLSHINKYANLEENGEKWPMYEGTGDLRSDFDELVLLDSYDGDYDVVTSSLYWKGQGCPWAKERSIVEPLSFKIDRHDDLKVAQLDCWVDTRALKKEAAEIRKVSDLIQDIHSALIGSPGQSLNRSEIVKKLKGRHSERQIDQHLPKYIEKAWTVEEGLHNASIYTAIKGFKVFG